MSHYSLGLHDRDRVDHAFGGGLPQGSVTLIEGPDGAGKSALTQRMSYGIAEEGYNAGVLSTELTTREFIDQMHSLSYDIVDHLLENRLLFLPADVDTHDTGLRETTPKRELLAKLTSANALWKADVAFVDGLGSLLRNDPTVGAAAARDDEDHTVQRLVSFLREVTSVGKAVVFTVNDQTTSDRSLRPIRDVADVLLELQSEQVGQEIRRKAVVHRFAGQASPVDDTIGFSVQQGRGIVIESRTLA